MTPTSTVAAAAAGSNPPPSTNSDDFESFYHNVCSELQNAGEVHAMSKLFALLETDEDRVRFILERNLANAHLGTLGTSQGTGLDYSILSLNP